MKVSDISTKKRPPKLRRAAPETPSTFDRVFVKELEVLALRRQIVGLDAHTLSEASTAQGGPRPAAGLGLLGLTLSGGGIRSASFSLGVLQALEHAKLNHHFDYLSTVSGGGFTGSTMSSALHHARIDGTRFEFSKSPTSDAAIVAHLRNQSSYLNPGGFLNTVRLPAMIVRGFMLNLLALFPWLFLCALLTELYYAVSYNDADAFLYMVDYAPLVMGGLPFVCLLVASPMIPRLERHGPRWRERYETLFAASLVFLVAGILSHFMLLVVNFAIEHPKDTNHMMASVAGWWVAILVASGAAYQLVRATQPKRLLQRAVMTGTGLLVPLGLFSAYVVLNIHLTPVPYYQDAPYGVSEALVEELQMLANTASSTHTGQNANLPLGVDRWLRNQGFTPVPGSLQVAPAPDDADATGAIKSEWAKERNAKDCIELVKFCSELTLCDSYPAPDCRWQFTDERSNEPIALSLWGHGETSLRADRGHVSLSLYRIPWSTLALPKLAMQFAAVRSIASRFQSESEPTEKWFATYEFDQECLTASIALALSLLALLVSLVTDANGLSLHGFYRDRLARAFVVRSRTSAPDCFDSSHRLLLSDLASERSGAPYPLLNATLNLSGGVESAVRFRRGTSFLFSPQFVGSQPTGYAPTRAMERADPELTLASATAISAAAAGPNMGSFTSDMLAPLFALFNLRLGYWLLHPQLVTRKWWLLRKPNSRLILREALGQIDDRGAFINVSDGGHFENLGAYELIRRKCRLIVAVDSEEDRLGQLNGLTTLMRLARIDFGTTITADLRAFRAGDETWAAQPWLWATIDYGTLPDGTPEVGYLLYIKATMIAGVPHYVTAYCAQNPDFPHESTADQFFNETQFECYRALGYHLGGLATTNSELLAQITELLQSAPAPSRSFAQAGA